MNSSLERECSAEDDAKAEAITPNRFIKAGTPPAILFFGTNDALKKGADGYLAKAKPLGLRAELWTAEGPGARLFQPRALVAGDGQKSG